MRLVMPSCWPMPLAMQPCWPLLASMGGRNGLKSVRSVIPAAALSSNMSAAPAPRLLVSWSYTNFNPVQYAVCTVIACKYTPPNTADLRLPSLYATLHRSRC